MREDICISFVNLNWIFDTEIAIPLKQHIQDNKLCNWNGITKYCLSKMFSNKDFYCKAIRMEGQNNLRDHMQKRNRESWDLLINKYINETNGVCVDPYLTFVITFTAQAVCNMAINWALEGMKTPVDIMAKMDNVATRGVYGVIDSISKQD